MIKWVCIALVCIWIFSFLFYDFAAFFFCLLWFCSWPIQISLIFSRVHSKLMWIFLSFSSFTRHLRFRRLFCELTSFLSRFFRPCKIPLFTPFYDFLGVFTSDFPSEFNFSSLFHLSYLKLSLKAFFPRELNATPYVCTYLAGTLLWTSILFWVGQFGTLFSRCAFVWIWYKSAKL